MLSWFDVAFADRISWAEKRGSLSKAGFSSNTATHTIHSDSGANHLTVTLSHTGTSRDLFTFSKWEIDRWGDPTGQLTSDKGSWQVVSNAANDVVLGVWGWDGAVGTPRVIPNESTTYEISLTFDRPVTNLELPLQGINALFTNNGYNCLDGLSLQGYLGNQPIGPVRFEQLSAGVKKSGVGLTGIANNPVGSDTSTYDEGSVRVIASKKLDRIVLSLPNRALTQTTGTFQNGQQAWSLSLGELSFENEPADPTRNATAVEWLSRKGQLSKPGFSSETATTTALSKDGRVRVALTLEHDQFTPNLTHIPGINSCVLASIS